MAKNKTAGASKRTDTVRMSIRLTRRWAAFVKHCVVDDSVTQGREVELGEVIEKALPLLKKLRESKAVAAEAPGPQTPATTLAAAAASSDADVPTPADAEAAA